MSCHAPELLCKRFRAISFRAATYRTRMKNRDANAVPLAGAIAMEWEWREASPQKMTQCRLAMQVLRIKMLVVIVRRASRRLARARWSRYLRRGLGRDTRPAWPSRNRTVSRLVCSGRFADCDP